MTSIVKHYRIQKDGSLKFIGVLNAISYPQRPRCEAW